MQRAGSASSTPETDDDFDLMPYTLKVPADESPVSIPCLDRVLPAHDRDTAGNKRFHPTPFLGRTDEKSV